MTPSMGLPAIGVDKRRFANQLHARALRVAADGACQPHSVGAAWLRGMARTFWLLEPLEHGSALRAALLADPAALDVATAALAGVHHDR